MGPCSLACSYADDFVVNEFVHLTEPFEGNDKMSEWVKDNSSVWDVVICKSLL